MYILIVRELNIKTTSITVVSNEWTACKRYEMSYQILSPLDKPPQILHIITISYLTLCDSAHITGGSVIMTGL